MKRWIVFSAGLILLRTFACDVRDFGAKGDGVADDTAALQKAADAVFAKQGKRPPQVTRHWTTGWDCPEEELFFPAGTYRITGPIVFQGNVTLRGEKGAVVRNDSPTTMSFFFHRTLRVAIRGLTLSGASVQVHHWTANADTATLLVSDCTFSGATDTGIISRGWDEKGAMVVPYDIMRNEEGRATLSSWSEERRGRLRASPNSTSIIIERCRFENMARAAKMLSDGIIIRDCTFVATSAPDAAVLDLSTVANVMRSSIRVTGHPDASQCAIRFHGAQNVASRLDIDSDGDLTAFVCDMIPRVSYAVPKMSLTDIALDTLSAPVVRFPAKRLAQMIVVNGLSRKKGGFWQRLTKSDVPKRVFAFDEEPTVADVSSWATAKKNDGHTCKIPPLAEKMCFSLALDRIDAHAFDASVPAALRPFLSKPIPGVRIGYEERHAPVVETWPERVGTSMGASDPDAARDDTDALRALFASVTNRDGATVVLPSKWLRVSGPIAVPPKTHVTARGRAFVTSTNDNEPVFTVADADDVRFENIAVTRGRHAIVLSARTGLVRCRNCYFYDQLKASITTPEETAGLRVEVTGGIAYTPYFYSGAANPMLVDGLWYSTAPNRPKGVNERAYAAMTNRAGGRLLLYDVLGVPCYFGNIPMGDIENDGVAAVGHYTWVANRGTLRIVNSRLGGEWNGLTIAYSHGLDASTYIEGGADACYSRWLRGGKSHVVADRPDASVTFVDVTGFDYFLPTREPMARFVDKDGTLKPLTCRTDGSFPFDAH